MKTIALTILAVFMMASLTVSTGFAGNEMLDKSGEALEKANAMSDGINDKVIENHGELEQKSDDQIEKVIDKVEETQADVDKGVKVVQDANELKDKALGLGIK
jgi:polyhydroxyalkanoate synthesis regulator phasin